MSDETVSQLNHLVEICRNGQKGFHQAAERSTDAQLRLIFADLAHQREQFAAQLRYQVSRLGGRPHDTGTVAGAIHRRWIDVRTAASSDAERALIRECERGERFAIASYKLALDHCLHPDVVELVKEQQAWIELAYRRLREVHRRVGEQSSVADQMDAPL